jgi:hypothetical protein
MNITSTELRDRLKFFDKTGLFSSKVSKSALLRDSGYYISDANELKEYVSRARSAMTAILEVSLDELPEIHTGSNGRWDCDNYAFLGSYIVKAIHDKTCRKTGRDDQEYTILPISRSDIDHTQAISLTNQGWYLIEFITGEVSKINDSNKPEILLIG